MDKNNIIGFVLIALVLIGYSWYAKPSKEQERAQFVQDSIAQAKRQQAEQDAKTAAFNRQQAAKQKIAAESSTTTRTTSLRQTMSRSSRARTRASPTPWLPRR